MNINLMICKIVSRGEKKAVITKIEKQKNNTDRVNIYIDNEFFLGVSAEIVYKYNLRKGMEINEDMLKEIIDEENYIKAKNTAFNILSHSMQSEEMIRTKLKRKKYEEHIIDRVIKVLKEYKMIDDIELANIIIRDKQNIKKIGKNRIKQDLYNKKIDSKIIEEALSININDEIEYENALYIGEKKMKSIKDIDKRKAYEKLARHLLYKGFSYDIVNKVARKLIKDINK